VSYFLWAKRLTTLPLPNGAAALPNFIGTPPTCLLSPPRTTAWIEVIYLCAGLPALLKLQRIALNGQSSVAVALGVFQTQKMSGRNAEWCARVYWGSGALGQCA
jgi:hypothetical protein